MKPKRTPQQKKLLSYLKDRRNAYGENDKASRKAIKRRKTWVNQAYRRTINQVVKSAVVAADPGLESVGENIKNIKRKSWKKYPDIPLGKYLEHKRKRQVHSYRK